MQISHDLPQFLDQTALIVVTGKERGIIYKAANAVIEPLEKVEDPPLDFSDREGFFFRSGYGTGFGSGAPMQDDFEADLKRYFTKIADELTEAIKAEDPMVVYMFEPEHLKGRVREELQEFPKLTIHVVRYGNYVDASPDTLLQYIADFHAAAKPDTSPQDFKFDQ